MKYMDYLVKKLKKLNLGIVEKQEKLYLVVKQDEKLATIGRYRDCYNWEYEATFYPCKIETKLIEIYNRKVFNSLNEAQKKFIKENFTTFNNGRFKKLHSAYYYNI